MIQIIKWVLLLILTTLSMFAQETFSNREGSKYQFKLVKNLDATPVENQNRTGTCWSFSSLSYLESEIIRLGHKPVNLSEMYVVRNAYLGKAVNYLRMGGNFNFSGGGAFHDSPWVIKRYGIVPEQEYLGLNYGYDKHFHGEMEAVLKGMVEAFNKKPQHKKLTKNWKKAFIEVVDAYLGDLPDDVKDYTFMEDGVKYNPISYAKQLGLNMDDYISLTLQKDLLRMFNIRNPKALEDLTTFVASESSQTFNYENMARNLSITNDTVREYLDYLESVFLISREQFYSKSRAKRIRKQDKIYLKKSQSY